MTAGRFSGGEFENKFNKVQVGADTALAAYGSRLGLSFSYTQGDADMSGMSGISADTDAYSLAAYGMWFGEAGQFADVIGRVGTVDTDLATRTYKTNYDQLMLSLSGEFGWRFDLTDTFYAEPSAELTYTRVDGETFKANSNTLGIDDYDSMVGRIGATAGLNCSQGRGGVYARFGVAHEFMGDGRFTAVNAAGTAAALRRAHHGVPQHAHDDEDDEIRHKAQPPGCLPRGRVVVLGENAFGLLLLHEIVEIVVEDAEAAAFVGVFRLPLVGGAQLHGEIAVGVDGEGFDLLRLKKLDDFRIDKRFLRGVSRHGIDRAEQQHEDQYEKADLTGLVGGGSVVQKLSLPFLPSHRTARTIYKSEIYFSYTSGLRTPMNGRLRYFSA